MSSPPALRGTCGTCETPALEGVPDHRDSVLDKEQRPAGDCMMICVSRACTPHLVLDLLRQRPGRWLYEAASRDTPHRQHQRGGDHTRTTTPALSARQHMSIRR